MKFLLPSALPQESAALIDHLDQKRTRTEMLRPVVEGFSSSHNVLIVDTGMGTDTAGIIVQHFIDTFRPDAIIFSGVAGALPQIFPNYPSLNPFDILVATDVVSCDFDIRGLCRNAKIGENPFAFPGEPTRVWTTSDELVHPCLLASHDVLSNSSFPASIPYKPKVVSGHIISGNRFVQSRRESLLIAREFAFLGPNLCIEMEGIGVSKAAITSGKPYAIIRAISDSADESAESSFSQNLNLLGILLAEIVLRTISILEPPSSHQMYSRPPLISSNRSHKNVS